MLRTNHTGCCGLDEISDFYESAKSAGAELTSITKNLTEGKGAAFITLTQEQWPKYGVMVRKHGFNLVAEFNNPNTHNNIRMYVRVLNKPLTAKEMKQLEDDEVY